MRVLQLSLIRSTVTASVSRPRGEGTESARPPSKSATVGTLVSTAKTAEPTKMAGPQRLLDGAIRLTRHTYRHAKICPQSTLWTLLARKQHVTMRPCATITVATCDTNKHSIRTDCSAAVGQLELGVVGACRRCQFCPRVRWKRVLEHCTSRTRRPPRNFSSAHDAKRHFSGQVYGQLHGQLADMPSRRHEKSTHRQQ